MAKKSKLLAALDAHRGRDHKLEKQRKQQKQAEKRKKSRKAQEPLHLDEDGGNVITNGTAENQNTDSERWESEESDEGAPLPVGVIDVLLLCLTLTLQQIDISTLDFSESESDSDPIEKPSPMAHTANGQDSIADDPHASDEEDEDEDGHGDIPLSDIDSLPSEEKADIFPHQRLTINNTAALLRAHKSISASASTPFSKHQTHVSHAPISIPDVNDDLTRELAFYKQCLDSANEARAQLKKEHEPFSRPDDYFAEMVKSDEHMRKIKQKMMDEAANKKAAAEARKQRDLKRFGKQVQVAKLQERDKAKREMLGKIEVLKRSILVLFYQSS